VKKQCPLENSFHKISIQQKQDINTHPTCGFNSEILLDGKILKGVEKVVFEMPAEGPAVIYLKMVGNLEITGIQFDKAESSMVCLTCKNRLKCEVTPFYKDNCARDVKFSVDKTK